MAAEKFKPEMGVKFISYAVWWIKKIILVHLQNNGKMVRLPANKINSLSKLDKKINDLEQKLGRNVDISEIITEFGGEMGSEDFELLDVLSTYSMDSLDREIGGVDGDNTTTLGDMLSDESSFKSTDHLTSENDLKLDVNRILNTLKPREKRIIIALFGLDGNPPMTLHEVGDEIGVTREMIRQIRKKVLLTLKTKLSSASIGKIEESEFKNINE